VSRRFAALLLLAVALATGCGPSGQHTAVVPSTPGSPAATGPSPSSAATREVRVGLTEWSITTDSDRVASGTVTLTVTNAGTVAHDLRVTGPNEAIATTTMLRPGEQQELTFTTPTRETLLLWCTVPGHSQQGMRTTLRIAG